ncbi:MAG: AraC family transcriptional regulator [Clostridia bacterium]|nr:AraC family transcriptional regulator [Clostridia bacterium]
MSAKLSYVKKVSSSEKFLYPGYVVAPQTHHCHEIVFYDVGCHGTTEIGGIEYEFTAGDIAMISANTIHSERHFDNGKLYFFGFTVDDLSILPPNGLYRNIWDIKFLVKALLKESVSQEWGYEKMLSHKVEEVLLLLSRKMNPVSKTSIDLSYVKQYIEENYVNKITIEELAKSSGYSYDHFRHIFKNSYGISPQKYLIDIRCEKAISLLKSTKLSCTEIAYHCGFTDSAQLTKIIKNRYGFSPLQLRKQSDISNNGTH